MRKVSARGRRYSYDALKVLQRVWAASGGQCGKYLAASVPLLLDLLQARGEPARRAPLHACRAGRAGGDGRGDHRAVPGRGARLGPPPGISATKAGPLLRSSITTRKASGEAEAAPGIFEVDSVAYCGGSSRESLPGLWT